MPSAHQVSGARAEQQAANFLIRQGWKILDRHVTSRFGEIDILAKDGQTIVAVEVKYRTSKKFGTAAENVTQRKLEKIELALNSVLAERGWERQPMRIDVITLESGKLKHLIGVS